MIQTTLGGHRSSKKWTEVDGEGLLICFSNMQKRGEEEDCISVKVAAYDLDHTLISPKAAGQRFSRNERDWKFCHPNVPETLQKFHSQG